MHSPMSRRWIAAIAFALPLLTAILTDLIGSSDASSGASAVLLFELFVASVVVAAALIAFTTMTAPKPIGRRLALLAVIWSLLFLEAGCALLWILRGLD